MAIYFYHLPVQNLVKIGTSQDVDQRLKTLTTGCTEDGVLLRVVEGFSFKAEAWLHSHFKDLRVKGEWFQYSDEMLSIEIPRHLTNIMDILLGLPLGQVFKFPSTGMICIPLSESIEQQAKVLYDLIKETGVTNF